MSNLFSVVSLFSNGQKTSAVHTNEGSPLLLRIAEQYEKFAERACLPNKVISNILSWMEKLPEHWHISFADQLHTIKSVSSTFVLPVFFIKQLNLYLACDHLKNIFTKKAPAKLERIVAGVKKVFLAFLSSLISGLKVPQMLHKTHIIDLRKVSRLAPSILAKTVSLLSLTFSGMKLIDTASSLKGQLEKEKAPLTEQLWHPSSKVKALYLKLGMNSLGAISNSISAASTFLGVYTNPFVTLTVSTISLTASVVSKFVRNNPLFGIKDFPHPFTGLPA